MLQQNKAVMEAWFPAGVNQLADIGDAMLLHQLRIEIYSFPKYMIQMYNSHPQWQLNTSIWQFMSTSQA